MTVSGIAADGSWLQVSGFQGLSFQELGFQTLTAALGALAFGIVYRVRNERLPVEAAGGGIGWFLYSVIFCRWESIFISNMAASVFATLYSEAMARKLKAPVVVFLLPCLIPLVPGGELYYTMSYAVLKEMQQCRVHLSNTAEAAIGIAAGVIVVSVLVHRQMPGR